MTRKYDVLMHEVEQKMNDGQLVEAGDLLASLTKHEIDAHKEENAHLFAHNEHLFLAGAVSGLNISLSDHVVPDFGSSAVMCEFILTSTNGHVSNDLAELVKGFIHGLIQKTEELKTPVVLNSISA